MQDRDFSGCLDAENKEKRQNPLEIFRSGPNFMVVKELRIVHLKLSERQFGYDSPKRCNFFHSVSNTKMHCGKSSSI